MFNTSVIVGGSTQNVTFNSPCTGILQKSTTLSKFIRFQKGSTMEEWVFPIDGRQASIEKEEIISSSYDVNNSRFNDRFTPSRIVKTRINICILQILVFGDNYYLCEYIEDVKEEIK